MIGLAATLVSGIVLGKWAFALSAIPYLLRFKSRNLALIAFYLYALPVVLTADEGSLYTPQGLTTALLTFASTFLLLDELLRGPEINRKNTYVAGILLLSAFSDYTVTAAMIGLMLYVSYARFGKEAYYLAGWMGLSGLTLYLGKNTLQNTAAQSLVLIGLGLLFLLFAERKEVSFSEVSLLEED